MRYLNALSRLAKLGFVRIDDGQNSRIVAFRRPGMSRYVAVYRTSSDDDAAAIFSIPIPGAGDPDGFVHTDDFWTVRSLARAVELVSE